MFINISDAVQPEEVLDVANVLYNIVTIPSLAVVEQLPPDVLSAFLTFLAQSTCTFCRAAAAESVWKLVVYTFTINSFFHFTELLRLHLCFFLILMYSLERFGFSTMDYKNLY
jgi:hypothetical protein